MKLSFKLPTLLLILGLIVSALALWQIQTLYDNYQVSRIDFSYVVESNLDSEGKICNLLAVYKGEELAGENRWCGTDLPTFQPGEMVKVIWNPDSLQTAKIYTFGLYWADAFGLLGLGLNLLLASLWVYWGSRKRKKLKALLASTASTVNLTVFGVQENKGFFAIPSSELAVFARYDPMDDAFSLFPQSGKNVNPKDRLRMFKFVVPAKSKDGIARPLPSKDSIIRAKLDLNDSHGLAYWPDHDCLSEQ